VLTFPLAAVKKLVKRFRKSNLLSHALKEAVNSENKVRLGPLHAAEKAVETALGKLKEAEEADKPSRKRIKRRQEALKEAQDSLVAAKESAAHTPKLEVDKLKQHVETRWNSVFVMLERLVLLRAPVVSVCLANTGDVAGKVRDCSFFVFFFFFFFFTFAFCLLTSFAADQVPALLQLSNVEWQYVVDIKTVLRPFYDVTRLMCSQSFLSLPWFGAVVNNLLSMCAPNPEDQPVPRMLRFRLTTKVRVRRTCPLFSCLFSCS
jgi:hypothetical protein